MAYRLSPPRSSSTGGTPYSDAYRRTGSLSRNTVAAEPSASAERVRRLEERTSEQAQLIDRLLLGKSATAGVDTSLGRAGQLTHGDSPGRAGEASHSAAGASESALRLEVVLLQQRSTAAEERLGAVESTLSRLVARVEDVADRIHTEARTVEGVGATASAAADAATAAERRVGSLENGLEEHLHRVETRIKREVDARVSALVAAEVERAVGEEKRASHTDASALRRRVENVERGVVSEATKSREQLVAGLQAAKRHVSQELAGHTSFVQSTADRWECVREELARAASETAGSLGELRCEFQAVREAASRLDVTSSDLERRSADHSDELQALNRRLVSMMRHLSVAPCTRSAAADVSAGGSHTAAVSPIHPAAHSESTAEASQDHAAHRTTTPTRSPRHAAAARGGAASEGGGAANTSRPHADGPIDDFLAELSSLAAMPPPSTANTSVVTQPPP